MTRGAPGTTQGLAARQAALAAVRAVEEDGAWSTIAVPAAVDDLADARDRSFASHLAYETLRWRGTLDWALDLVLSRPLHDVEPGLLAVLRLGAAQLLRSRTPDRAAVGTAADLARTVTPRRRAEGAAGFVNGVLRALARRGDRLPWPDPDRDPVGHLALTTGHPRWIVEDLYGRYGPRAAAILQADNEPPGVTLRAAGDRDALVTELRGGGIAAEPTPHAPEGVRAPGLDPRRAPSVLEGRATPQDEASMLVVAAAGPAPGDRAIDLCAGPGGKATHLAERVGPSGSVTAVELRPARARLVEQAADRLGLDIDVHVGDARTPPAPAGGFDVVLLDAPCTGLGVGRRRPEIRWRRRPEDARSLARVQTELLAAAWALAAPGGRLVYAVCTWTAAETDAVAGPAPPGWRELGRRQWLPDHDEVDGMYVAAWRREGQSRPSSAD